MTDSFTTDPATAAHSTAFEIAYETANAARRSLFSQAAAFAAHLVRQHLPEAATLTIDADAAELHEVLDSHGNPLWHAPSSAGRGLPDSAVDEVDGILRDAIPFGSLPGAARWKKALQGLPYRTVPLPELPTPKKTDRDALTPGQGRAQVRAATEAAAVIHATVSPGVDSFTLDGIAHDREARDRVRAATLNGGYSWPLGRITVTVETVTGRPLGSMHDLAIACAILSAAGHYDPTAMNEVAIIGELGLDGRVRAVPDINDAVRTAIAAGCTTALIPDDNMSDIDEPGIGIYSAANVDQAVRILQTFDRANRDNS